MVWGWRTMVLTFCAARAAATMAAAAAALSAGLLYVLLR